MKCMQLSENQMVLPIRPWYLDIIDSLPQKRITNAIWNPFIINFISFSMKKKTVDCAQIIFDWNAKIFRPADIDYDETDNWNIDENGWVAFPIWIPNTYGSCQTQSSFTKTLQQ